MEGENFAPFEGFLNSFQSGPMAYVRLYLDAVAKSTNHIAPYLIIADKPTDRLVLTTLQV